MPQQTKAIEHDHSEILEGISLDDSIFVSDEIK
jgi:hypothetical protein